MRLTYDGSGVESVPLRLMIVAVVATLSIIPASEALENLRDKEFIGRAKMQLESITTQAEVLCTQGPGGARTLSLDFSSDGSVKFSRLVLGGSRDDASMCCASLELSTGSRMVSIADEPPVWICAKDGTGLEVGTPVFDLRLSAALFAGQVVVLAEAS